MFYRKVSLSHKTSIVHFQAKYHNFSLFIFLQNLYRIPIFNENCVFEVQSLCFCSKRIILFIYFYVVSFLNSVKNYRFENK